MGSPGVKPTKWERDKRKTHQLRREQWRHTGVVDSMTLFQRSHFPRCHRQPVVKQLRQNRPKCQNIPPTTNTSVLCSPSQINRGTALMRLAKKLQRPASQTMLATHNKKCIDRMGNDMNTSYALPYTLILYILCGVVNESRLSITFLNCMNSKVVEYYQCYLNHLLKSVGYDLWL